MYRIQPVFFNFPIFDLGFSETISLNSYLFLKHKHNLNHTEKNKSNQLFHVVVGDVVVVSKYQFDCQHEEIDMFKLCSIGWSRKLWIQPLNSFYCDVFCENVFQKEWILNMYTSDFKPPRYDFTARYHRVISIELILELPFGTDKFVLMRWKWNFGSSEKVQLISR